MGPTMNPEPPMSSRRVSFPVLAAVTLFVSSVAQADVKATTSDGREVLLRPNGTWIPVEQAKPDRPRLAVLTLEKRADLPRGCRIGLRLQNDLGASIRTLVLRFTAYKDGDIPFETVSRGYSYVKPTTSQYQEVTFRGIACDDVSFVEIFAARNCHVGELTKYSADAEDCLQLFEVTPSEQMVLSKRQAAD
jgi:hypothetical protein